MKTILLILSLIPAGLRAQSVLPAPGELSRRTGTLKLGLTSLLGPDAVASVGVELPVGARQAWQIEGGYGWFNSIYNVDRSRYAHQTVWQVRTEFRWYGLGEFPPGAQSYSLGPYVAVELVGKQINVRDQATVGRDCQGFTCGYFEKIDQPVARYTLTGLAKTGWQLPFRRRDQTVRFVADLYVGIGGGYGWNTRTPLSANGSAGADVYYNEPRFLEPKDRFAANFRHYSIDFVVGAKAGYRLNSLNKSKNRAGGEYYLPFRVFIQNSACPAMNDE